MNTTADGPSVLVPSADGTPIACWTSGSGPALVLVHGAVSDHRRWRILPFLEPTHTVWALDRRGRGASGDAETWSLEKEVEDVVAVIEHAADSSGRPVDVLGHSLGGLLALRACVRTDRVRRLVVYEPSVNEAAARTPTLARIQDQLDAGRPDDAVVVMMREVVLMPEEEIAFLRRQPSWPARVEAAPTVVRELSVDLLADEEELRRITVPVLSIVGGDSPPVIQEAARLLDRRMPHCTTVVMPGQQHVADQTVPEEFARHVVEFLERDAD